MNRWHAGPLYPPVRRLSLSSSSLWLSFIFHFYLRLPLLSLTRPCQALLFVFFISSRQLFSASLLNINLQCDAAQRLSLVE